MDNNEFHKNWVILPECLGAVLPRRGLEHEQTSAFAARMYFAIMLGFPWALFLISRYKSSPWVLVTFSAIVVWLIMGILARIRTYMAGATLHSVESYTMHAFSMDHPELYREYLRYRKSHELEYFMTRSKSATFKDEAAMVKLIKEVEDEIKEIKNAD